MYWYLPLAWTLSFWDGLLGPSGYVAMPLGLDDLDEAAEIHSEAFTQSWSGDEFASLMLTFMTFGAGFLMRPLGAVFLGAYVDRVGRRQGLIVTLAQQGEESGDAQLRAAARGLAGSVLQSYGVKP